VYYAGAIVVHVPPYGTFALRWAGVRRPAKKTQKISQHHSRTVGRRPRRRCFKRAPRICGYMRVRFGLRRPWSLRL